MATCAFVSPGFLKIQDSNKFQPPLFAVFYIKKVEKLVTSPKVDWFGFPSSMGEEGIRATLAALGELVEFSAEESEDGMTMNGRVVFGDADTAKKCVDQYDGMDMGLGTAIEMDPV